MCMGLNKIFSLFQRNKEFPAKGRYREVEYNIDGDVVTITCSSGREILYVPRPNVSFDQYNVQRKRGRMGLSPMISPELQDKRAAQKKMFAK